MYGSKIETVGRVVPEFRGLKTYNLLGNKLKNA